MKLATAVLLLETDVVSVETDLQNLRTQALLKPNFMISIHETIVEWDYTKFAVKNVGNTDEYQAR